MNAPGSHTTMLYATAAHGEYDGDLRAYWFDACTKDGSRGLSGYLDKADFDNASELLNVANRSDEQGVAK